MIDVVRTNTGRHTRVNRGVTVNGNQMPDTEDIHEKTLLE